MRDHSAVNTALNICFFVVDQHAIICYVHPYSVARTQKIEDLDQFINYFLIKSL